MPRRTAVTVSMLPELTLQQLPHPFLYCPKCGAEYSANAADYWNASVDVVFRCCRRNMLLVQRVSTLTPYIPA